MTSETERDAFLAQPHVAVLATLGPHQYPHAVPVWYLYEAGEFTLTMSSGSQKHRNIERCPNVSLVVDRRERPYYAVTAMGVAQIGDSPTYEWFLRLASHYLGVESGTAYTASHNLANSVTIRLRPSKYIIYP
ncbi:TIGR03618 family F420-dependent PPOX class oxidoreductase [Candidatus Entotheonella palauensis]|uniref:TIGR03618 family F420-dependent PPOX class oxidoreductase n=1 Tax=Candidatus Entotheonella palauensis TaxID=93172 RepID=UPI000B7F792A|nr:TIGR03618 family F420-dependent PPOX class oxidoreductase [Candidatus Entotheonella palauensis]